MTNDKFKELFDLDVAEYVAKDYKGLSYISWSNAYKLMMEADSKATWKLLADEDGFPCFTKGDNHIVMTEVTMFGETKGMFLPVMDNKHNAVGKGKMNSRHIGDSIMRCLVKNIALFGLGLRLYCGMDIIDYEDLKKKLKALDKEQLSRVLKHYEVKDIKELTDENIAEIGVTMKWL